MQDILIYFENIPTFGRTLILVTGLSFFLIVESLTPLFRFNYNKGKHAAINITFTLITLVINLFGAALIVAAVEYTSKNQFGILQMIELPVVVYIIVGLALMDLIGAWLIHFLEHKIRWMWRFHIIHHSDTHVDVTSGLRHHPGENILRLAFTTLAVLVVGPAFGLVMLYQTISAFFAHLSHANIQMPKTIDRLLSFIVVTPHFHKVHHHFALPKTDSHYGNIFSLWDHIFNCSIKNYKIQSIKYGLDTHMDIKETRNIKTLLLIPFQKYRAPRGSKFSA